jgi:hypothetical protein
MASEEDVSIEIMRALDVDYVLVIFGGLIGYSSDDINKFLWMIRIAGSTDPNIKERDYFTPNGGYEVGHDAPPAMYNSLMYKLTYYRFGEMMLDRGMSVSQALARLVTSVGIDQRNTCCLFRTTLWLRPSSRYGDWPQGH